MRNLDREATDESLRKYTYDIDLVTRKFLLDRVEPNLRLQEPCLEVGSHDGNMTELILRYFNEIDILEPAQKSQEILEQKFRSLVSVHPDTIQNFEPQRKFGNIFLVHVLEHLDNPKAELQKISNWLSDSGVLIVAVPNANALSRKIAVKMNLMSDVTDVLESERRQGHLRTYNLESLLTDIQASGLRINSFGGVMMKPFANFQFDEALTRGIITHEYLNALNELSKENYDGSSTIYAICTR